MSTPEPDPTAEPPETTYDAQVASTSAHPVSPAPIARVREVLSEAFTAALANLGGGGDAPEVEVTRGQVALPPPDPRAADIAGLEQSTTRTAVGAIGQLVLHETSSRLDGGAEIRTTIALTGSGVEGERFWLGATSYAGGPVDRLELLGDLPGFAAPVLGQVLSALRR